MDLIVQQGGAAGRTEPVSIERTAGGYRVCVGERTYEVDAVHAGARRSGLAHLSLRLGDAQHEVAVRPGPLDHPGRYEVTAGGVEHTLDVADPLAHLARATGTRAGRSGRVAARMPGRVVAVLAAEGSEVVEGQGVVVIEAMKMENEIPADRAGTLKKVHVTLGQAVETGEPLFEVG